MVPNGFGVTAATLDAMFRVARKFAGINDMTFHDTRYEGDHQAGEKAERAGPS